MTSITASELKTKGVSAIEFALNDAPEAVVSVGGKDRFVVMHMAQYHYLRECELTAAIDESRADIAAGRFVTESVAEHMARLDAMQ
jgi:predicted transcriptional regulator